MTLNNFVAHAKSSNAVDKKEEVYYSEKAGSKRKSSMVSERMVMM